MAKLIRLSWPKRREAAKAWRRLQRIGRRGETEAKKKKKEEKRRKEVYYKCLSRHIDNPVVFFDISIGGHPVGRIKMELYRDVVRAFWKRFL